MTHSTKDIEFQVTALQERGEASETVLHLLAHLHEMAEEAGLIEMAAVIGRAKTRCISLHVAEKRSTLEAGIVQGGIQ